MLKRYNRKIKQEEHLPGVSADSRNSGMKSIAANDAKFGHDFKHLPVNVPTPVLQSKLSINEPGDKYEQQANAAADKVAGIANRSSHRGAIADNITPVSQYKGKSKIRVSDDLTEKIVSHHGGGNSLDQKTRSLMGKEFGADFSKVRIHTDPDAVDMNRALGARAFTVGADIYFNSGEFDPDTGKGKMLLAHELTHTVQQKNNAVIQKDDDRPEAFTDKKTKATKYKFQGRWYEQKHFDFFKNAGYDTMAACLKENFSMLGSLFTVALITTESGWGTGKGGKDYPILFIILGGEKGNLSTGHGTLKKFATYEEGFNEGFVKRIVDGVDGAGKAKFPSMRAILSKPDFTIDEANEAFGQAGYYKPGKRYSYEADSRTDWAEKYFNDMKRTTVPFMRNELRDRIQFMQQFYKMLPFDDEVFVLPEIQKLIYMQTAVSQVETHVIAQLGAIKKK